MTYGDIVNLFLKRLIELREQKGVSARDMSLSLGQNRNYINLIENKHNLPSMSGFFYICEYLGLSPVEFFDVENENPYLNSEIEEGIKKLSADEAELINGLINKFQELKEK